MNPEQRMTVVSPGTQVLDHAQEFVNLVIARTPGLFRQLRDAPDVQERLHADNRFNDGKLYAWAEYLVFRAEFERRFPQAGSAACINAFSSLFLKNDISLSNLVESMESPWEPCPPQLDRRQE